MLVGLRGPSGTEGVCEPARERACERVNVRWQAGGRLSACCACTRLGGSRASLRAGEWRCAGLSVRRQLHPGPWEDWLLLQPDGALPGGLLAAAPGAEGRPEPDVRPAATALHPGRCSAPSSPAPSGPEHSCLPAEAPASGPKQAPTFSCTPNLLRGLAPDENPGLPSASAPSPAPLRAHPPQSGKHSRKGMLSSHRRPQGPGQPASPEGRLQSEGALRCEGGREGPHAPAALSPVRRGP